MSEPDFEPRATRPNAGSAWFRSRFGLLFLLALGGGALRAHDPFEITTDARLGETTLEVRVTMARSTALAVARGVKEAPTFAPEEFAAFQPQFEAVIPRLYSITTHEGATVALRTASAGLGVEADVEFRLIFERPAGGALRFEARQLALLGPGFGDVFALHDVNGAVLMQTLLSAEQPATVANIPATLERRRTGWRGRSASAVSAMTIVFGACWLMRRRFF